MVVECLSKSLILLGFSKSWRVWGFNFLILWVDWGIGEDLNGWVAAALSKTDFKAWIDIPEVMEWFEDLWVIEDSDDIVDKLDIEVTLVSLLFFISGELSLIKDDLVSEKDDSQSKKSSVLTEILS